MFKLLNQVQHYPWGSTSEIPRLLKIKNNAQKPYAEMWMGIHPNAVSKAIVSGKTHDLDKLIESDRNYYLGSRRTFPFLLKILAAAKPLSIQLHPNKIQAESGYQRENAAGIPQDHFKRNYRDSNHKPEIICALTPFHALKGFRTHDQIIRNFGRISSPVLAEPIRCFSQQPNAAGLEIFFRTLLNLTEKETRQLYADFKRSPRRSGGAEEKWIDRLAEIYPDDIGVFSPYLLNLVTLDPGQALFIQAGELHAYLEGTGIELMASSDNVLRGGLTKKHVDKQELLRLTKFEPARPDPVPIRIGPDGDQHFHTECDAFQLSRIVLKGADTFLSDSNNVPALLLCTEGRLTIYTIDGEQHLAIEQGDSLFIPAGLGTYKIAGNGTLYKAT